MTEVERLGYIVGDRFRVMQANISFAVGSVVELIHDNGGSCPAFALVEGHCYFPNDKGCITLHKVNLLHKSVIYETLPPESNNDQPVDGSKAFDILKSMF